MPAGTAAQSPPLGSALLRCWPRRLRLEGGVAVSPGPAQREAHEVPHRGRDLVSASPGAGALVGRGGCASRRAAREDRKSVV